jgi:hypothetical protein
VMAAAAIDLRGNIPSFIHVSDGKMNEVNVLDLNICSDDCMKLGRPFQCPTPHHCGG